MLIQQQVSSVRIHLEQSTYECNISIFQAYVVPPSSQTAINYMFNTLPPYLYSIVILSTYT
jgi:hypothetical protein